MGKYLIRIGLQWPALHHQNHVWGCTQQAFIRNRLETFNCLRSIDSTRQCNDGISG